MDELKELYIEPTSHCNLNCVMCPRNSWRNKSAGHMSLTIFDKLIEQIPDSITRIFFGGVGEPLYHSDIMYMIHRAKKTGRTVELITNGTLLNDETISEILDAKLDMLWISLDSMEEESYEYIRSGAQFTSVMSNIQAFNKKRGFFYYGETHPDSLTPRLGIAFVLMKRNLSEYSKLLRNAHSMGLSDIRATHLIPYDKSQLDQICYERIMEAGLYNPAWHHGVRVDMPLMDTRDIHEYDMLQLFSNTTTSFSFMGTPLHRKVDYCRFIHNGVAFVRWDGEVCPCMALLHEQTIYQQNKERYLRPCGFGNINEQSLLKIWEDESYASFRQRVLDFEFSYCTYCGPCDKFKSNEADCFGNTFPTCGACLWAQGVFQCP